MPEKNIITMSIPFSYNLRNLIVRKTTTIMTALGIALTIAVLVADLALINGLNTVFKSTGNPLNVLVMRKGTTAELTSVITQQDYQVIKAHPGIEKTQTDEPMSSLEVITIINIPSVDNPEGMNITTRGLSKIGIDLRKMSIKEGNWFREGMREVVVGESIAKRYPNARLGQTLKFGRGEWKVVGIMKSSDAISGSEIWGDANQIGADLNRADALSAVMLRAKDSASATAIINSLKDNQQINVQSMLESQYMESQTSSGALLKYLGIFVAVIMAIGSSFAAMNTMYAAVARRAREIGTLRVLGFSKSSIMLSFLIESLIIALLGGIIGILIALPLNAVTTGVGNDLTFSEVSFNFKVGVTAIASGLVFAALVGAIGGLFPAFQAARKEILTALREI